MFQIQLAFVDFVRLSVGISCCIMPSLSSLEHNACNYIVLIGEGFLQKSNLGTASFGYALVLSACSLECW